MLINACRINVEPASEGELILLAITDVSMPGTIG